ncbi:MAG: universal stress protein [Alphaproteobacteria bacterium]|nr:universal stress protein [Alphaproteobacteria bacterium]
MNKIVVAIDFSECSINAFLHALSIAEHCEGELILLWVEKTANEKEQFGEKTRQTHKDVERAFEDLVARYQPEHPDVKMTWKIRKGKIYKEVTAEARTLNAMIIVTGTHGASGFEEFWIGSNANKIVSASYCPVITIRGGINIQRPLKKILIPIDSAEETRQKATFVGYLAKRHNAEICVLKLYTSKLKAIRHNVDLYAAQVTRYFDEEQVKYQVEHVDCESISDATIEYAKKIDANLIGIMTEQETTTVNIFLGPYAHQIVNHSPIPVLSIHPKDTLAGGTGF